MKIAIVVLFCLCLIPYVMAFISGYFRKKQFGKVDNQNPREQYAKLEGVGARAVAAQQNSWEALGIYTATSYSLNALFNDVFKSVDGLRVPMIKAQGTWYSPPGNFLV